MPTNLLILPFLGGYWFLHHFILTRDRSQRLDGYRLLGESAFVGVMLVVPARVLVVALKLIPDAYKMWRTFVPEELHYAGTALMAFGLGLVLPKVCNLWLTKRKHMTGREAQARAIVKHGNHLLVLLHEAIEKEHPVAVTLDNRKVYIGLVTAAPNLAPHDTHMAVAPFFSGYRDKDTLELTLTVDYLSVYEANSFDRDDFRVVIATEDIKMATLFDHTAYPKFIVEAAEPEGSQGQAIPEDPGAPL